MKTHTVRWIASLNNGETYHEEKGDYKTIEGELSPWQRLQKYIQEKGLRITSLGLQTAYSERTYNLPSAGANPRFKAFEDAPKPVEYKMYRRAGVDIMNGQAHNEEVYTVAEATYGDGRKLQIWVHETTLQAWTLII